MAYLPSTREQDEQEPGKPVLGGEPGIVQTGAAEGTTAPVTAPGSGKGSGFVDLRRYLEENAGKTGAFANRVGGDVDKVSAEAEKGIDTAKSAFETSARGLNNPDESFVKTSLSDPTRTIKDREALDRFQALRTGTYRGPTMMGDVDISGAQAKGKNLLTAGGLEELTSGYTTDPSKGKSGLNVALLMQSPEGQSRLEQSRARSAALADYLSGAKTASEATASDIKNALAAFAPKVRQFGDQAANEQDAALTAAYRKAAVDALGKANAPIFGTKNWILSDWQKAYKNPEQAESVYVKGVGGDNAYPFQYITETPFSKSQYASADDYARDAALEQLMNRSYDTLINSQVGEAGTSAALTEALKAKGKEISNRPWQYGMSPFRLSVDGSPGQPYIQAPTWNEWLAQNPEMKGWV